MRSAACGPSLFTPVKAPKKPRGREVCASARATWSQSTRQLKKWFRTRGLCCTSWCVPYSTSPTGGARPHAISRSAKKTGVSTSQVVTWTQFSSSSKTKEGSKAFRGRNTKVIIYSQKGRYIDQFSNYSKRVDSRFDEEEVLFLPFTRLLVLKSGLEPAHGGDTQFVVYCRELELGITRVIGGTPCGLPLLWVDDNIHEETFEMKEHMQKAQICHRQEIKFILKRSTELALAYMKSPFGQSHFENSNLRVTSDMTRDDDREAGAKLALALEELNFQGPMMIFTGSMDWAAESLVRLGCSRKVVKTTKDTFLRRDVIHVVVAVSPVGLHHEAIMLVAIILVAPCVSGEERYSRQALSPADAATESYFSPTDFVPQWSAALPWPQKLRMWLQSSRFEMLITTVLCINVLWMALELQIYGSYRGYEVGVVAESPLPLDWTSSIDIAFRIGDGIFTGFFVLDVVARISLLRMEFFKVCMNYLDLVVTAASVVELTASQMTMNPMLFRLLRIGKLARVLRMVTMSSVLSSLELLIKCLSASLDMLLWTFCLLTFIQCVAGMVVSTLCSDFLKDAGQNIQLREEVYRYYGTFTRTFLTMFEILFANWGPPCRVLVENVSEWFSVFFLLYRCVLGFAVLNVVNAVFVQQTMKTASSDEELAFKQKERDMAAYARKVRRLFQTMDDSHDGAISLEEFSKLVKSPKLKFWMSQL
ncbi:Scn4a, partial [Symbiodinium natans]